MLECGDGQPAPVEPTKKSGEGVGQVLRRERGCWKEHTIKKDVQMRLKFAGK